MQLKQLVETVNLVDEVINEKNLVNKYNQLVNQLNQASKNPNQNVTNKILELKESIFNIHLEFEKKSLPTIRLKLLDEFGAAQDIQALVKETKQLQSRINNLKSGLGPLLDQDKEVKDLGDDESLIQLVFEGNASVETINDLESASKSWRKIIHSFSRVTQTPSKDAQIYSIEQGSLLVELIGLSALVGTIAKATTLILGVYEKYLSIKKHALEIDKLELENGDIKQQLLDEAENVIDQAADDIAQKLLDEKEFEDKGDNYGEVRNATKSSLKDIFHFVENGGKIDFYSEEEDEESEEKKALADSFKSVREIETRIDEMKHLTDGNGQSKNGKSQDEEVNDEEDDNE